MDVEYEAVYQRELFSPLDWFRHDTNATDDHDIQNLCDMWAELYPNDRWAADAAYGLFWQVAECLAKNKEHCYAVGTCRGLTNLVHDMSVISKHSEDEVRQFMGVLAACHLIDREAYSGGKVISARILRNAEEYAAQAASKKCRAKAGASARWKKASA